MIVRNLRPYDVEVDTPGGATVLVEAGGTVEVDDRLGKSLLKQPDAWGDADSGARRLPVGDILADVGDDPDRARTALALEQQADKPRKTLVSRLEEIVATSEETV